jgi:hypothetical protein
MSIGEAEPKAHTVTSVLLPGVKVDVLAVLVQSELVVSQAVTVWAWAGEWEEKISVVNTTAITFT